MLNVVSVLCSTDDLINVYLPYLAVPPQWQVLGVVDDLVVFVFALTLTELLFLLFLALLSSPGLLPLHVLMSQLPLLL